MKTNKTPKQAVARYVLIAAAAMLLAICAGPAKATSQEPANDTTRKNVVIVEADGLHNTDSMDYVINGKKSTQAEFEKIKYDGIVSVNWVSAENAAKIFNTGDSDHSVLFVTTKNSEAGKKMLAKVNTVENHKGQVFSTKEDGVYAMADGKLREIKPGDADVVTLGGYNVADDAPMIVSTGGRNKTKVYNSIGASSSRAYTVGSGKAYSLGTAHGEGYAVSAGELESGSELSDINNKLVIINDKEATAGDLKKLSAFDIDKMSFKDDDYTRHQYGDKAKNGVVYIYTKKAKK